MKTQVWPRNASCVARILLCGLLVLATTLPSSLPLAASTRDSALLEPLPVASTLASEGQRFLANIGGALAFDPDRGLLALRGTESAAPLRIEADTAGFLTVKQSAHTWSSDPNSAHFTIALAGVSTHSVTQLWVDKLHITEVTLADWSAPSGLALASAAPLHLVGQLQAGATLAIQAPQLTVAAELRAPDLRLQGDDWVSIAPDANVRARNGEQGGRIQVTGRLISSVGSLDATGANGGEILLEGESLLQAGTMLANGEAGVGGLVQMRFSRNYMATVQGITQANGTQGGGGVQLDGGATGHLYSSGQVQVIGLAGQGGDLLLLGQAIVLAAAHLDAGGSRGGGQVRLGGGVHGADPALPNADQVFISPSARIAADAGQWGNGGALSVWAEDSNTVQGVLSARGGRQSGNGGQIETSARRALQAAGDIRLDAPNGTAGHWQLDPKHLTISDAPSGLLPQFALLDPSPNPDSWFGSHLLPLRNGHVLLADANDNFAAPAAGAVYLFDGLTGALISTLTGSSANDMVGNGGMMALRNGNYIVLSRNWANGATPNAGAVTWANGATGVAGVVSTANSLVGTQSGDIGSKRGVAVLNNGNYLVFSTEWDNGATPNAGAVTWGNGATGIVGAISAANSLVGTQANDYVGAAGVTELSNGNYVVHSPDWDNGATPNAGALTWANGATGVAGAVSPANSLVGSNTGDMLGQRRVVALSNGNYVALSPEWDNGAFVNAGAVTWGNGAAGVVGAVSTANSLVGAAQNDSVGSGGVVALNNGNYVVSSPNVYSGGAPKAGAVTWGNGATGSVGTVSAANSLVGAMPDDYVGNGGVVALNNGNYVVSSYLWDNDKGVTPNAGAVTWGNGSTGVKGLVGADNSLVGVQTNDYVGNGGVAALNNGNYVVSSYFWDSGPTLDVGAVTWVNGTTGMVGAVATANSLVGAQRQDNVGYAGVTALRNGHYVVNSPVWDNGTSVNAGAVTWGNGVTGLVGTVAAANSLVGAQTNDNVGSIGIVALNNDNYVVSSPNWDNGPMQEAGAVTWGNGATGVVGVVSPANSLVGAQMNDYVGGYSVIALTNGNYVVRSPEWDQEKTPDVGAVTWGDGTKGVSGVVSALNSLVGTQANDYLSGSSEVMLHNSATDVSDPQSGPEAETMLSVNDVLSATTSLIDAQTNAYFGYGVVELSNGNYVVSSPLWDNGATPNTGAATWVDGSSGRTLDGQNNVTAQNSLIGAAANSVISNIEENGAHNSFASTLSEAGNGRVVVAFTDPNQLSYRQSQQQAISVTPAFLERSLNRAVAVTLQANSDLTLNTPLQVKAANGTGGALTLQAGRTLNLNANLTSANAPVTLIANDVLTNGVVDSERDPGVASLVMASNTTLDAGSSAVVIALRNGAGKRHTESGAISLQNVIAGSLVVSNTGTSPNSDLLLGGAVNTSGAQHYHTRNGVTTVAANLTTSNAPILFDTNVVINRGVTLNSGTSTVELVGADPQSLQAEGATLGNLTHRGIGTLRLRSGLTIGGNLRNLTGDFDANGQAVTISGATIFSDSLYRPGVTAQVFNGDFTLQLGATLRVDLNGAAAGQFSQLQVGGTVNLAGPGDPLGSTLQVVTGFTPALNTSFMIIDNDSNSPVIGAFAGLPEGATFSMGAATFQISYQGGDGNDVVLTALQVSTATPTPTGTPPTPTPTATGTPPTPTPTGTPTATVTPTTVVTPVPPNNLAQKIYLPLVTR